MKFEYPIHISWSEEDDAYLAMAPQLDGAVSHGSTPEEALQNIREVIALWVETATEDGHAVPAPYSIQGMLKEAMRKQAEDQEKFQQEVERLRKVIAQSQQPPVFGGRGHYMVYHEIQGVAVHKTERDTHSTRGIHKRDAHTTHKD